MLIIFGGAPGAGKTTLSRQFAHALGAVYHRIVTMDQPIMRVYSDDIADVSYRVAHGIAGDTLSLQEPETVFQQTETIAGPRSFPEMQASRRRGLSGKTFHPARLSSSSGLAAAGAGGAAVVKVASPLRHC